jgi:hypothetical protein
MSNRNVQEQVLKQFEEDREKAFKKARERLESIEIKPSENLMQEFADMLLRLKEKLCKCLEECPQGLVDNLSGFGVVRAFYLILEEMALMELQKVERVKKKKEDNDYIREILIMTMIETVQDTIDELTPKSESKP